MRVPSYLAPLSRAQVCARIWALSRAIEELECQSAVDGKGAYLAVSALETELAACRARLDAIDAPVPLAAAVNRPRAVRRLQRIGADIAEVRAESQADRLRDQAWYRHRAQELARTAGIREMGEALAVPEEELRSMAPSFASEFYAERVEG